MGQHPSQAATGRTYCFIMFSQRGVDDAAIEQDLRCLGNLVEISQALLELLVVIGVQGLHPGFNFLPTISKTI